MKLKYFKIALLLTGVTFIGCSEEDTALNPQTIIENDALVVKQNSQEIPGQYIVTFNSGTLSRPVLSEGSVMNYEKRIKNLKSEISTNFNKLNIKDSNIKATFGYALEGFVAQLSKDQLKSLRNDPRVKSIEEDYLITLAPPPGKGPGNGGGGGGSDPQETPWGITRVGGAVDGTGKTAWIIDSGIDADHPDLNVDVNRSRSYVTKGKYSIEDGSGHGTHVAGTVAALDNNIGVIGVAPGATIVALRVLDNRGSGQFSWNNSSIRLYSCKCKCWRCC